MAPCRCRRDASRRRFPDYMPSRLLYATPLRIAVVECSRAEPMLSTHWSHRPLSPCRNPVTPMPFTVVEDSLAETPPPLSLTALANRITNIPRQQRERARGRGRHRDLASRPRGGRARPRGTAGGEACVIHDIRIYQH
ncbi:hypothetical protein HYPSUDRAFT_206013 [Hypholoma sublateritium FD-334 SS-4]|uniref:Uncharacterized protein n=1 Tax=Hypholoma sublateritium (strain FD-334 SS-4) TaxID=945553 RepID=A0A0D2KSP1_HYPSF|nr:hypothetical protein HYPSUDRAFT_206013 [Hypholoma sublateritium FD-334 SS-4]